MSGIDAKYIVVTAVKNEERAIGEKLSSMITGCLSPH